MSLPRIARLAPPLLALLAIGAGTAAGDGALVEVDDVILRADGGFKPQSMPRHRYVPISFNGHVEIAAKGGGKPPPLQEAVLEFDHDGRLDVAGLASCDPQTVSADPVAEARAACGRAIVGTGRLEAMISIGGGVVRGSSQLTIFNGPRLAGGPSVVIHARIPVPTPETIAILAPILKHRGNFRYRVPIVVPPIAGGLGALTHVNVAIDRRYRAGGRLHSYVAARCSDGVIQTHGLFAFGGGTVISGQVEKFCRSR